MDNFSENFIIKKKRGNFEIKCDKWTLKLDDSNLYVKQFPANYIIDLKNLIVVSLNVEKYNMSYYGDNSYTKETLSYNYYIKIKYLEKEKIKTIKLVWKEENANRYLLRGWKPKKTKYYVEENVVRSLLYWFLTTSDMNNEIRMKDSNFFFIRNNDENVHIQQIIQQTDKSNKKLATFAEIFFVGIMLICGILGLVSLFIRK